VSLHFGQIAVITDVVATPVFVNISRELFSAAEFLDQGKGLKNGAGVALPSPKVIDFAAPGGVIKGINKPGNIFGVNVVPHLFSLIAENGIFFPFKIAFNKITQKSVQLHP
jgi:hypothetical protein